MFIHRSFQPPAPEIGMTGPAIQAVANELLNLPLEHPSDWESRLQKGGRDLYEKFVVKPTEYAHLTASGDTYYDLVAKRPRNDDISLYVYADQDEVKTARPPMGIPWIPSEGFNTYAAKLADAGKKVAPHVAPEKLASKAALPPRSLPVEQEGYLSDRGRLVLLRLASHGVIITKNATHIEDDKNKVQAYVLDGLRELATTRKIFDQKLGITQRHLQYEIAYLFLSMGKWNEGVFYLRMASNQSTPENGYEVAQYTLGGLAAVGAPYIQREYHDARILMRHSTQKEYLHALAYSGEACEKGWIGMKRDLDEAAHHYDSAAEQNHPRALRRRGLLHQRKKELDEAFACFERAVAVGMATRENGQPMPLDSLKAMKNLVPYYRDGIGGAPTDYLEAMNLKSRKPAQYGYGISLAVVRDGIGDLRSALLIGTDCMTAAAAIGAKNGLRHTATQLPQIIRRADVKVRAAAVQLRQLTHL